MEEIHISVPAILQVDPQHIACVLPWDLHNLCILETQLEKLQGEKLILFKNILDKCPQRKKQILAKNNYVKKIKEVLTQLDEEEDEEWEILSYQLVTSPIKLTESKAAIAKDIAELKQLRTEVDIVYREWVKETELEGQHSADIMLAMMNPSITEPLLTIGGNLKDLISNHLAESKGEQKLLDKMAQKLVQLYKFEDLEQEHKINLTTKHIQEVLENVKKLCFPLRDENLSQRMKKKFQAKINCSTALDQRLTKITVLPESISPSENINEDDAEDENISEPNVANSTNEYSPQFRKISTLQVLLEEAVLHPPPEGSGDEDLMKNLIPKYQECLIVLLEESSTSPIQLQGFRNTLNNIRKLYPKNGELPKNGSLKLKIKDISLPQFSGKESEYFSFKADVLDLLNNSRHDANSQTRSLKSDCFKNCSHVLDLVRNSKTVSEIFEILDARFGNVERHSSRIISSIEKCPPAQEHSKSIIALADCIFKINNDICGADALETVASFQTISKIKSKFSPLMSREYVKRYSSLGKQDSIAQWNNILEYLKEERDTQLSVSSFEISSSAQPAKAFAKVSIVSPQQNCVLCNGNHSPFDSSCSMTGKHLTPKTREKAKSAKLCLTCLNPACTDKYCMNAKYACRKNCRENGKRLHKNICDCVASLNLHNHLNPNVSVKSCTVSNYRVGSTVMLHEFVPIIDKISKKPVRISITYDMGATDSLCNDKIVLHGKSKHLGKLNIGGFSNECNMQMKKAKQVSFTVKTQNGLKNVDSIQVSNLNVVSKCSINVPKKWNKYFPQNFTKVGGETDLLLGGNCCHLFPTEIDRYDSGQECLILFRSVISGRYLLFGRDKNLVTFSDSSDPSVNKVNIAASGNTPNESIASSHDKMVAGEIVCNDLSGDLDLRPLPSVVDVIGCNDSSNVIDLGPPTSIVDEIDCINLSGDLDRDPSVKVQMTVLEKLKQNFLAQLTSEHHDNEKFEDHTLRKQLEEEKQLQDGINFDPVGNYWTVTYCYTAKIGDLQTNYKHVLQRMTKLDQKLTKKPELCTLVNSEIAKNISNGYWMKCDDIKFPAGCQKHYIPYSYIESPSSVSTPCRIVCDSSARDSTGLSLNQCQKAGRSFIGNMRGCLLKSRVAQQMALGDLSKFFHSFRLNPSDASLRRILVPIGGFGNNSQFEEYCQVCIPFGDKAASILSCMARDKNVDLFSNTVPGFEDLVTMIFKQMTYVDDVIAHQSWNKDIEPVLAALDSIAESGGLKFKKWIKLGDETVSKFLGYNWDPVSDCLLPRLWFNIGKLDRGIPTEDDLTLDNVEERVLKSFTKRDVLSVQGQFFDPLLILSPIIVKLRLFFGEICSQTDQKTGILSSH